MILGAVISLVGVGLFAAAATQPSTSYHTFAALFHFDGRRRRESRT